LRFRSVFHIFQEDCSEDLKEHTPKFAAAIRETVALTGLTGSQAEELCQKFFYARNARARDPQNFQACVGKTALLLVQHWHRSDLVREISRARLPRFDVATVVCCVHPSLANES
jgi:hypothetical protein